MRWHARPLTAFFAAVALTVALAITTGAQVPVVVQVIALAALVGVVGLPHGALDPLVARNAGIVDSPSTMRRYLLEYVGLALATAVGWWLVPGVALPVFLLVSALHFGGDWPWLGRTSRTLAGITVVGAPIAFHPSAAVDLLTPLATQATAERIVDLVGRAAPVVLVSTLVLVGVRDRSATATFELGLVVALSWLAPPLVAFTVYFCALHSPRHIGEVLDGTGVERRHAALTALLFTSLTIVGASIAWWALPSSVTSPDDTLLQIVFVGLAALTVPHMRTIRLARRGRRAHRRHVDPLVLTATTAA